MLFWKASDAGKRRGIERGQITALAGAFLLMFCFGIVNSCIGYFVVPVSEELGVGRSTFNLHYTIMLGVSVLLSPGIARKILPKTGAPLLVVIGAFVCSLGLLLFSFVDSIWKMFAVSVFMGLIQLSCTNIIAVSTVTRYFPEKSGLAMGIAMAGTGVNNFVMGAALPTVIDRFGWRFGYRFHSMLFLVLALLAAFLIKGKSPHVINETSPAPTADQSNHRKRRSASLAVFIVAAFIVTLCTSFNTQLPAYLRDRGTDVITLSSIMSVASIVLTVSKVALGFFYDLAGKKPTIIFVLGLYAVSFLTITMENTAVLIVSAATISVGMASSTVLPPLISKDMFGSEDYTSVWAIINASVLAGGALGSVVWGSVYDFTGSYYPGMIIAPVLLILAMFIWVRQIGSAKC